jgi:hypothetical protein
MAFDIAGGGVPRPLVATPFEEGNASLSKDARFLAYESDELDSVVEIYVQPFHAAGPKVRVSTTGARWPRFGASGRLYYWLSSRAGLRRVGYRSDSDRFVPDGVQPVWSGNEEEVSVFLRRVLVTASYAGYDVEPAAEQFLMLERTAVPDDVPYRRPVVVLSWWDDLRALDYKRP